MNTAERADALAEACRGFESLLGPVSAGVFLDWLRLELGHAEALDAFQPLGGQWLRAIAPRVILHIFSGNTPHAALQSLVRGLLLGSHNLCKLPGAGLPEAEAFVAALPMALRDRVEFTAARPDAWLSCAEAVIVFGSDETVAHFRELAGPQRKFLGYGHRISLGMVFEDAALGSAPLAARDASLFDQQGCLSPHCLYVADRPEEYAARVAAEMERIEAKMPRSPLTLSEAAAISELREITRFRAATGQPLRLWESAGSDAWTVIYDADPTFAASVLNRVIFIRPLPTDASAALDPARPFLSTIGIWPNTQSNAALAAACGASRICGLGRMQEPMWTWRHDGRQTLAPLVSWTGWEP
ncbi:MAG TPA: acyl-CoA reductase [Chthoniobacteraceae bacterium]|jgi:hypothetical protein|nr:acyl-CoA reductase [Chthoniobacteraceae bacterium]